MNELKMVPLVYVLVFDLLITCSASSPYIIQLEASWAKWKVMPRNKTPLSLIVDEPFTIQVSSDKPVYGLRCTPEDNDMKIYIISGLYIIDDKAHNYNYMLKTNVTATADMTGSWKCTAYQNEGVSAIVFPLQVIVTNSKLKPPSPIDNVNKCRDNPCHHLATCNNTVGSFICSCLPGYMGDGFTCTDINECVQGDLNGHFVCSTHANCSNIPGKFICSCLSGYSGNAYEQYGCVDVNECESPDVQVCGSVPGSTCRNSPGSYKCICQDGYVLKPNIGCTHPDPCATHPCGINALCEPLRDSFHCSCPSGLRGDANKQCYAARVTETTTQKAKELEAIPGGPARGDKQLGFSKETASSVLVNDVQIPTITLDKDQAGYDRKGEYWYREGELAKITCLKLYGMMNATLKRYYYNDTPVFITTQLTDTSEQTVFVKLTSKDNGSYIDCNVETKMSYTQSWNTDRLYFYKLTSERANTPSNSSAIAIDLADDLETNNSPSDWSFWWIIIAVAIVGIPVVIFIAVRVWQKLRSRKNAVENCHVNPPDCADDHEYQRIDYSSCLRAFPVPSSAAIASRPPCPPPPRALPDTPAEETESQGYIHYDTVYEHRLEHMLRMNPPRRPSCKYC